MSVCQKVVLTDCEAKRLLRLFFTPGHAVDENRQMWYHQAYYRCDGVRAMYETNPEEVKLEGSYIRGLIGALIGTLIGAVLWCLVGQLDVMSSVVGFSIGWLAEKGYTLMKGKVGTGKVVILVICVILGVLLGMFASEYVGWYQGIAEFYPDAAVTIGDRNVPVSYEDIPKLILYFFFADGSTMGAVITDLVLGLVFAFVGVFTILRSAARQARAAKWAQEQAGNQ